MAKKVLFCASRASHIVNFHRPYLEHFMQEGWEVHTAAEGIMDLPEVDKSFDIKFYKKKIFSNVKSVLQLARLIQRENYTLINTNATLAGLLCKMAFKLSGCRNTALVHISHGYLFRDDKSLKSFCYIACEKLTSIGLKYLLTMNVEDCKIAKKYQLGEHIGFINGMGVACGKLPELSFDEIADVKKKIGLSELDFVFLCVGEFSKRKNQRCVIEAFRKISVKYPHTKLLFAGTGIFLEDCKQIASDLGNKVLFLGQINEMNELYRISNVVVSASLSEGLPFNIMEALQCHIPVIASKVKGHSDLLENGMNGILFDVSNSAEFSNAMELLINDTNLYKKMREQAVLAEKYTIEKVKPSVLEHYYNAVNKEI